MLWRGHEGGSCIHWRVDDVTRRTNAFINALATTLRECRESNGLSLSELAARSGLSQPSIGYIEKGERRPTLDSLSRLAIALGTSVSHISALAEGRLTKH